MNATGSSPLDVLAIAAHPDDAELTCGGTLIRCSEQGYRTGVLDLTRGEMGTKGTPELRAEEAARAAEIMGLATRPNADLPDAHLANSDEVRAILVSYLRQLRPRVVILPFYRGRHPDHRVTAEVGREACFLAGLARYGEGSRHPVHKILHTLAYREDPVKPTFVVSLTEQQFARKLDAIRCYESQFEGVESAGELYPTGQTLYELIEAQGRHYGSRIRQPFGEPFYTDETVPVDDILQLGGRSL